jgi:glycosyltransferase involved in cell wall biosynthesis
VEVFPLEGSEPRSGVLFVGGWLDVKGRRTLPGIVDEVLQKAPETMFTLVGTGVPASLVEQDFSAAARGRIRVTPVIEDDAKLRSLMERHAVFLMPSISEGSPLSLLEAMAAEMGIVASRVGGIPDVLRENETGMMFEPGEPRDAADRVLDLLGDPDRRAALGRAARADAAQLSWDRTALELERALLSAAGPG